MLSGPMFSIDPLWVYIAVPVILVLMLIAIKVKQEKTCEAHEAWRQRAVNAFPRVPEEKARASEPKIDERKSPEQNAESVEDPKPRSESSEDLKPEGCAKFLGYLYLRKGPDKSHIPNECYNCAKLLQCLYSPHVIQKVYGE